MKTGFSTSYKVHQLPIPIFHFFWNKSLKKGSSHFSRLSEREYNHSTLLFTSHWVNNYTIGISRSRSYFFVLKSRSLNFSYKNTCKKLSSQKKKNSCPGVMFTTSLWDTKILHSHVVARCAGVDLCQPRAVPKQLLQTTPQDESHFYKKSFLKRIR